MTIAINVCSRQTSSVTLVYSSSVGLTIELYKFFINSIKFFLAFLTNGICSIGSGNKGGIESKSSMKAEIFPLNVVFSLTKMSKRDALSLL